MIDKLQSFYASVDLKIWITVIVWISTFVFELILVARQNNAALREKKLTKLLANGHTIQAVRIKKWKDGLKSEVDNYEHAIYTYEVDGRSYKYHYLERQIPPMQLTLWYKTNPAHAQWVEKKVKEKSIVGIIQLLLPMLIAGCAYWLCVCIGL